MEERLKNSKWQKKSFDHPARVDKLLLNHWNKGMDRSEIFSKMNTKTEVIYYTSNLEYYKAKLDKLPSSSSWTKEETDCLMYLCKLYDLRFLIIADRFALTLKDFYDTN